MVARETPVGVLLVSCLLAKVPVPGYLAYSTSKTFASQIGKGLSFELEGLGIDILTYEPGFIKTNHFESVSLSSFGETPMTSAKVALAELEMQPYGASGGTNLMHEATEYFFLRILKEFGLFEALMFRYGQKSW